MAFKSRTIVFVANTYIKSNTDVDQILSHLEIVAVSVDTAHPIVFCVIYLPPNSSPEYSQQCFEYINELCSTTSSIVILGDFNFPDMNWDTLSEDLTLQIHFVT